MNCPFCAEVFADGTPFCPKCGNKVDVSSARVSCSPAGPPQTSGKALGSLICGLFAWIFPVCLAAVVLGHMALSEIRKSAGRIKGHGMAVAGLVLGYLGIAFLPIILIIVAAIAIPNLLRARMVANETLAIASLRTYTTALVVYADQCPQLGFPNSTKKLATLPGAANDCDHAGLVEPLLSEEVPLRSGYRFHYRPGNTDVHGRVTTYTLRADPVIPNNTGTRHFFLDESGVIRFQTGGMATVESAPLQSNTRFE
jgi:type IV pilus assembly protein PilA